MNPLFLELDEILEIHQDQIERHGGSSGIRDMGLLKSAAAMPAAGFGEQYLHADIYEMAAAYLFHIVQGHPFVDGNKRTGAMSAFVFLKMNNIQLTASEKSYEAMVLAAAKGAATKATISDFFRKHTHLK